MARGFKSGIPPVFIERLGAQKISTHQIVMELGAGKRVAVSRLLDLETGYKPWRTGGTDSIGIETCPCPYPPGTRASISEMYGDAVVGLARNDPDGGSHGPALGFQFDHICKNRVF